MTRPYAIALLGFTAFERSTFVSFFRLAARRVPGYAVVDDPQACDLIVANADDSATMAALRGHPPRARVLLVGAGDGGTGWPVESRPIKLMGVLTAVDQMLGLQPQVPAPKPATRDAGRPRPITDTPAREAGEAQATGQPADDGILVVDDSETALRFMRNLLHRVGFTAELVRSAEDALARLKTRPYRFVFLDVMLEGMDGYQACKLIKQGNYEGGSPPVVVMLTSKAGAIDKIRGTMAGCDAYLVKPLEERALLKLLARYDDQVQRGFQATRLGGDADKPLRG